MQGIPFTYSEVLRAGCTIPNFMHEQMNMYRTKISSILLSGSIE